MILREKIDNSVWTYVADSVHNLVKTSVNDYVWGSVSVSVTNFVRNSAGFKSINTITRHSITEKLRSYDFARKNW